MIRRWGMGLLAAIATLAVLQQAVAIGRAARTKAQVAEARDLRGIQARGDGIYWNEQADWFCHRGFVTKAFECYEKAVAADPKDPVILQNQAICLFLYRKDSTAYYQLDEQALYDKVFALYDRALRLDPENYALATDMAMTYYSIKPQRTEDALKAWNTVLERADSEAERGSVYLHLARTLLNAGRPNEARWMLTQVSSPENSTMKTTLLRRLEGTKNES